MKSILKQIQIYFLVATMFSHSIAFAAQSYSQDKIAQTKIQQFREELKKNGYEEVVASSLPVMTRTTVQLPDFKSTDKSFISPTTSIAGQKMRIISRLYVRASSSGEQPKEFKVTLASSLSPGVEITSSTFVIDPKQLPGSFARRAKELTASMANDLENYFNKTASKEVKKTENRSPASEGPGAGILILIPLFFAAALFACEFFVVSAVVFIVGEAVVAMAAIFN